jgi:formylglycine-generating enzyme required for sulfatase activity
MRPVGSLKPNDLGLFDMLGNALEWCQEWVLDDRSAVPHNEQGEWIKRRVLRGGMFTHQGHVMRSARCNGDSPSVRYYSIGFRPARTFR